MAHYTNKICTSDIRVITRVRTCVSVSFRYAGIIHIREKLLGPTFDLNFYKIPSSTKCEIYVTLSSRKPPPSHPLSWYLQYYLSISIPVVHIALLGWAPSLWFDGLDLDRDACIGVSAFVWWFSCQAVLYHVHHYFLEEIKPIRI